MLFHIPHAELLKLGARVVDSSQSRAVLLRTPESTQIQEEESDQSLVELMVAQAFTECDLDAQGDLSLDQFKAWVKRTPEVMSYLESVFPVMEALNKEGSVHKKASSEVPTMTLDTNTMTR